MRTISTDLQNHLDTGATTLCWCWRVTRKDGTIFGFTNHDVDITFDNTTFEAQAGFTASEISESMGLSVDNLDTQGVLTSQRITELDIAAGKYDDAEVEIFRVNWNDPSQRLLIKSGSIGELTYGETAFKAELRGLAHYLNQPNGRVIQPQCDADLGDARCGIDLTLSQFNGAGTVSAVSSSHEFTATGLDSFDDAWFTRGFLTWDTGLNAGVKMEIKSHRKGSTIVIVLWHKPVLAIQSGDTFTIRAGCDKVFSTCKNKFNNVDNFRGFPRVPGIDFVLHTAKKGDSKNDGGSRE